MEFLPIPRQDTFARCGVKQGVSSVCYRIVFGDFGLWNVAEQFSS